MRITTRNLKAKRKLVKDAIAWYAEKLLGKRLAKNVSIHVIGYDSLIDNEYNGLCQWTDAESRNHREFEIELNLALTDKQLLTVVAHEMVHVRQWARNHMKEVSVPLFSVVQGKRKVTIRKQMVRWMGKPIDTDKVDYWKYPWEKEAYRLEKKLYKEYANRG